MSHPIHLATAIRHGMSEQIKSTKSIMAGGVKEDYLT